jgi:hypothetical protein
VKNPRPIAPNNTAHKIFAVLPITNDRLYVPEKMSIRPPRTMKSVFAPMLMQPAGSKRKNADNAQRPCCFLDSGFRRNDGVVNVVARIIWGYGGQIVFS